MRLRCLLPLTLLTVGVITVAHADTYQYAVNNQSTAFSITGTITTDTNVGVLTIDDLTDYAFTLTGPTGSSVLSMANSDNVGLQGYGVTATPDGLYFDFDTPDSALFFQNSSSGDYLCYQSSGCISNAPSGVYASASGSAFAEQQGGLVQIASIIPMTVTPEPSSLLLLGTGALAVCATARNRFLA